MIKQFLQQIRPFLGLFDPFLDCQHKPHRHKLQLPCLFLCGAITTCVQAAPADKTATLTPASNSANTLAPPAAANSSTKMATEGERLTALDNFAKSFDQALWLSAADEKMFSLYQPDSSGSAQGAVLILHRGEEPPWWSEQLEQLRQGLPDHGWATLLVLLPTEQPTPPPRDEIKTQPKPAEASSDDSAESSHTTDAEQNNTTEATANTEVETATVPRQAEAGEDQEVFDSSRGELVSLTDMNQPAAKASTDTVIEHKLPLAERINQRITAAIHFLHQKNQYNLAIISDGASAAQNNDIIRPIAQMQAQIILNYRRDLTEAATQSSSVIEASLYGRKVPLLDIYIDQDILHSNIARERKRQARKNQLQTYQQIALDGRNQEVLNKRVRGFLNKHAEGVERRLKN